MRDCIAYLIYWSINAFLLLWHNLTKQPQSIRTPIATIGAILPRYTGLIPYYYFTEMRESEICLSLTKIGQAGPSIPIRLSNKWPML